MECTREGRTSPDTRTDTYTLFLAGGIASGKSSVARLLQAHGAVRCDLDQLSRDVLAPGSPLLAGIADAFGSDLVDTGSGELDRGLLARRAFATPEGTARLEALELPAIRQRLVGELSCQRGGVCVVEIPLLDRMGDLMSLADEVMCVVAPLALRRERAQGRGMTAEDFDRRVARQTTDDYLVAHADTILHNDGDRAALQRQVDAWWERRSAAGWAPVR